MRHSKFFLLREIGGEPYLMPWGQPAADQRRGMKLNKTGAWLWRLLDTERTEEELLALLSSRHAAASDELPILEKDLSQFLQSLRFYGMLEDAPSHSGQAVLPPLTPLQKNIPASGQAFAASKDSRRLLRIGGLKLLLAGPREIIPDEFSPFEIENAGTGEAIHQTLRIHRAPPPRSAAETPLLDNQNLVIYEGDTYYRLLFPSMTHVEELLLSKDASWADVYCIPTGEECGPLKEDLFHAIRFAFLYLALKHHMTVIHSASLLYRGRAWLFSGRSGTGKSTHTNLWHELLQVPLLNGDLNLLAFQNGRPVVHGLPWCGTSAISVCGTYPLGGILLLKQDRTDFMEALSPDAGQLLVLQRLISPLWTPDQLDSCIDFVGELSRHIYIGRLHCTKNHSAVETARREIDRYCQRAVRENRD